MVCLFGVLRSSMKFVQVCSRVVGVLACLATASFGAPDVQAKHERPRPLSEVIWDKGMFVTRLPKKTLCFPSLYKLPKGTPSRKDLDEAIKTLGNTPETEFIMLPEGFALPKVKHSVKPHYPWELAKDHVSGSAEFLVLIGASGKVAALYCNKATEKDFATAGAACLVQWSFTPSEVEGTNVAVMVLIPVTFNFH